MKADIYEYRNWDNNNAAIVFIHGFTGHIEKTWGKFPEYLTNHQEIQDWNIFSIGYPTRLIAFETKGLWSAYPGILTLADDLRTKMEIHPFDKYRKIAFIAHSMGGLILQQAIVDSQYLVKKTSCVFCFGTPSSGLNKASIFMRIFHRRQIRDMNARGDFIHRLRRDWGKEIGLENPPFYFRAIAGMQDEFVKTYSSQTPFPEKMNKTIPGNHLTIVKPDSPGHAAVQLVIKGLKQSKGPAKPENNSKDDEKEPHTQAEELPDQKWPFAAPVNTDRACYCIDIEQEKIYQLHEKTSFPIQTSGLNPWNTFQNGDQTGNISLENLVSAIDHIDTGQIRQYLNDENNSQFMFGRYLYKNIFNNTPFSKIRPQTGETQLLFINPDDFLSRLPWNLMADKRGFLTNCSVSICPDAPEKDADLPENPTLLIVSSCTPGKQPEIEIHHKNLEKMLLAQDPGFLPGERLRLAQTLPEFKKQLKESSPQAIYLNVPFAGTAHNPKIVFYDNKKQTEMPVADLAELLEQTTRKPLVLYLNSYEGNTALITGAARSLIHHIPAVLTVRTPALGKGAFEQALVFWDGLLLKGLPPHKIISKMAWQAAELGLNLPDPRWAAPILHRTYDKWNSNPPKAIKREDRDPYWSFKLNRHSQFDRVFRQVFEMFHEQKPKSCAYLWYGKADQGVDVFHDRLKLEFQEKLKQVGMIVKNPMWPQIHEKPKKFYSHMMCVAFGVEELRQIPMKIREQLKLQGDKKGLVYIKHEPVRHEYQCKPENLKIYLKWWDEEFIKLLPEKTFGLLGISYIKKEPQAFLSLVTEKLALDTIDLKKTVFQILDELDRIKLSDLITFVKTHKIIMPEENRNQILRKILDKDITDGQYNKVINQLQKHEAENWKSLIEEKGTAQ